jgi:poly(3-hydroxybutyrate) depolymerase
MKSLSDTIARLAAFRAPKCTMGRSYGADRLSDLPRFGSNPRALRARRYIPEGLPEGASLVVVPHGIAQAVGKAIEDALRATGLMR